jgi:hypothetical protein
LRLSEDRLSATPAGGAGHLLFDLLQEETQPERAHPAAPLVGSDQGGACRRDVTALEEQGTQVGRAFGRWPG